MKIMMNKTEATALAKSERADRLEFAFRIISKGIHNAALHGRFRYPVPQRAVGPLNEKELATVQHWLTNFGYQVDNPDKWRGNAFNVYWEEEEE